MKRHFLTVSLATLIAATPALAHYGMIIPSDPMISQEDGRSVALTMSFSHPFEMDGMMLDTPVSFSVTHEGTTTDLLGSLQSATVMEEQGYTLDYPLERPGTYIFAMEPQPYWEPAEDAFIIHYTKTYVTAYGDDEGWDTELGLKTEVVPLTKPFGLWEHNVFQGIIKLDGEPVPYAEVEVEFFNEGLAATAPDELMITQTVKADADGVFTYAPPAAGWWGFAALNTADYTITEEGSGEEKGVELGAVIWVHFEEWTGQ
jgi:cobalt/nickel transport protein